MKNIMYLDCEFNETQHPQLLSLALVSAQGHEHYVELDLDHPDGAGVLARASEFVRDFGVLSQWGRVPGSTAARQAMGQRTAHWLLDRVSRCGQPVLIAHDYALDFQLLVQLLQETGQWGVVGHQLLPQNVADVSACFDAALAADAAYEWVGKRGLERHHALADAHALRASCFAVETGKRVKL